MAKKGSSSQPAAPDPVVVANAQSAANIASAEAQQKLNMVGSQDQSGTVSWVADPTQPGGYRQVTTLSQPEQQSYDLSKTAQNQALGLAGTQLGRVGEALSTTLTTDGLPALQSGYTAQQATGGAIQNSFDPGQAVQGSIGGDLNAARQQAIDAVYNQATSRLDPQYATAQSQLETKLANQGLGANSAAYASQQDIFNRGKTDAYNQANYSSIAAGEDAANALFGRQATQGTFANDAAAQMYSQNQGLAQFANTAQNQGFTQSLANAQMANEAAANNAQMSNAARSQGLQERAYIQNQPLNQFNSLMSSGQVAMPEGISYTPSQVGQTDVTGAYALQSQAQQANATRAANTNSGLMSGLFSLGSAAIMSDIRVKKNISRVGNLKPGIDLYSFEYVWGGGPRIGVLAQEVAAVNPAAVSSNSGVLSVDYGAL